MDTQTPTDIDPTMLLFEPDTANAPHEPYRRLREECPVARAEGATMAGQPGAAVVLSRFEHVSWALKHPEYLSSSDAVAIGNDRPLIPLQIDPPDHAKYRRLLDPEFSPKKMAALEPDFRVLVNQVIDRFFDRGECDFHEEFATPLPSTFFLRLTGLPLDDLPVFLQWRDNIIRPDVEPGDFDAAAEIRAATGRDIYAYFERALDERERERDEGLLSHLLAAEIEGERLTREELLDICYLLIIAGLDTVTATLDCAVAHLARNPERRQLLVERPDLAPNVVEELLRFESPVMAVPRTVAQDVTVHDVDLKAGDSVTLVIGAGNLDDAEFDRAHVADFERDRNRHLAFGAGPHRCLGSHLARLEARVALEEWHRRVPHYEIAPGAELRFSPGIRQVENLPLVFRAGS
ncbi:MAG TPA: cytochrome P450 [Acidimicrobiia bacterium]